MADKLDIHSVLDLVRLYESQDTNYDGGLTLEELPGVSSEAFNGMDIDGDGALGPYEIAAGRLRDVISPQTGAWLEGMRRWNPKLTRPLKAGLQMSGANDEELVRVFFALAENDSFSPDSFDSASISLLSRNLRFISQLPVNERGGMLRLMLRALENDRLPKSRIDLAFMSKLHELASRIAAISDPLKRKKGSIAVGDLLRSNRFQLETLDAVVSIAKGCGQHVDLLPAFINQLGRNTNLSLDLARLGPLFAIRKFLASANRPNAGANGMGMLALQGIVEHSDFEPALLRRLAVVVEHAGDGWAFFLRLVRSALDNPNIRAGDLTQRVLVQILDKVQRVARLSGESALDITDSTTMVPLARCFAEHPTVIMISCSTGYDASSIGGLLSLAWDARLFAPAFPTTRPRYEFDPQGRILRVIFGVETREFQSGLMSVSK